MRPRFHVHRSCCPCVSLFVWSRKGGGRRANLFTVAPAHCGGQKYRHGTRHREQVFRHLMRAAYAARLIVHHLTGMLQAREQHGEGLGRGRHLPRLREASGVTCSSFGKAMGCLTGAPHFTKGSGDFGAELTNRLSGFQANVSQKTQPRPPAWRTWGAWLGCQTNSHEGCRRFQRTASPLLLWQAQHWPATRELTELLPVQEWSSAGRAVYHHRMMDHRPITIAQQGRCQ